MSSYESNRFSRQVDKNIQRSALGEIKTVSNFPDESYTFDRGSDGNVNTYYTPYSRSLKAYSGGTQGLFAFSDGVLKLSDDASNLSDPTSLRSTYIKFSAGNGIEWLSTGYFVQGSGTFNHRQLNGIGSISSVTGEIIDFIGFGYWNFDAETELSIIRIRNGVLKSSIPQREWNIDSCQGNQGFPLMDFTKGNVFGLRLSSTEFGSIFLEILNPNTSRIEAVHNLNCENVSTESDISDANLCTIVHYKVDPSCNKDVPLDSYIAVGSMSLRHEGFFNVNRELEAFAIQKAGISTTETLLFSIKNPTGLFYGSPNTQGLELDSLSISSKSSGNNTAIVNIYREGVITTPTYNDVGATLTPAQIDSTGTFVSGRLISSFALASESILNIDLTKHRNSSADHYSADVDEVITFTAVASGSTSFGVGLTFNSL